MDTQTHSAWRARRHVLRVLLLVVALGAIAARGEAGSTFTAAVTSANPLTWDRYDRTFAFFDILITNTGGTSDAYEIKSVEKPGNLTGGYGWVYAPTPTLPLAAGQSATFRVWISGFDQPPPGGPPAGDYAFTVRIQSTTDPNLVATVTATVRRSYPADAAQGTLSGRVTNTQTGQVVNGRVGVGDPSSVNGGGSTIVAGGIYTLNVAAGTYWLWADGDGLQTKFMNPVVVTVGQVTTLDLALQPIQVRAGSTTPAATGDAGLPTYRASFTPDATRAATVTGFYTASPSDQPTLNVFDHNGTRLWRQNLPTYGTSSVPSAIDVSVWTSDDGAVDITSSGSLVASGDWSGAVSVYNSSGTLVWRTLREADVNANVPGPLGRGILRSSAVRFSPDGTKLAAGALTGQVYLFDALAGTLLWTVSTAGQIQALQFSPDGSRVYAGSGDRRFYALRVSDGSQLWSAALGFWPWHEIPISSDGRLIVTYGKDGTVRAFRDDGTLSWSRDFPGFVNGVGVSPDGQRIVVTNAVTGIYGFSATGTLQWYRRETEGVGKIFMGAAGRFFGLGFSTGLVRVYQLDGTLVWTHQGNSNVTFHQLAFTEDGARLLTNNRDGKVLVFKNWLSAPACTNVISPTSASIGAAGGNGTVAVTSPDSSCGWTAAANATWLSVTPGAGTGSGSVTYTFEANSTTSSRTGTLTIAGQTFTVTQAGRTPTALPPFGTVDTPLQGVTGVTGSISVTGWALDDGGVTAIRILRDPVGAEAPGTRVFLGNAIQVAGARPDVAAANPTLPLKDRAGWGYLLLTNMLPNQGNGTYTLYILADDADGHMTLLGSRTITCANASATKPFGAIDRPDQGETVSGTTFVNFGWALTPLPKVIPTDGSTITVFIDGEAEGRPAYNQFRPDIATLFPGLNNSNGAVGALVIDTTTIANGVHTISWVVSDSAGIADGIGSRYFTVLNGSAVQGSGIGGWGSGIGARGSRGEVVAQGFSPAGGDGATWGGPIHYRRGYDENAAWMELLSSWGPASASAKASADRRSLGEGWFAGPVAIRELERVELRLGDGADGVRYRGYLRVGDELHPLPIGSRLHPDSGVFTWQPGVGFIGAYDLVFLRSDASGGAERVRLRIRIEPR